MAQRKGHVDRDGAAGSGETGAGPGVAASRAVLGGRTGSGRGDGLLPFVNLIPNLVTVAAIASGMTSMRFAIAGELRLAALLIVLAAVLDTLDGFLARRLGVDGGIGAELDSLADFLDFGAAPAILLHMWILQEAPRLGWVAALAFVIASALRLARFNVMAQDLTRSGSQGGSFMGVPAPGGALLALAPLFVGFALPDLAQPAPQFVAASTVIVALLMVSRMPTPSLKGLRVPRAHIALVILGVAVIGLLLISHTWAVLAMLALGYAGVILWGVIKAGVRLAGRLPGR